MSCYTCKKGTTVVDPTAGVSKTNIFVRIFYFLIGTAVVIILVPIVVLLGIYMLFNTMILDKGTELMPSITFLATMLTKATKNKSEDDEDDFEDIDDEDFNPEDYELVNVEEIKPKNV